MTKSKAAGRGAPPTAEPTTACDERSADLLGRDQLRAFTRRMMEVRRFEETAARVYSQGKVSGFCHLYIGQEGVAVGSMGAAEPQDHVITAYRDHGHALLRGGNPRSVMAELMGKVNGTSRGRGGSMHLFDRAARFHGGHGIVGGHIPLAVGYAWAARAQGEDAVTLCYFGEGAINQGAFYESMNLASLWDLPVVFVCENNRYAMGTAQERASAISDLYTKAAAFGMPGEVVDGMDVAATWRATRRAVDRARKDHRPTLIEARCYRYRGHSMSDPAMYRTRKELEVHKREDPIQRAQETLRARGWVSDDELAAWDAAAREAAREAAEFASASPEPRLESVGDYVYMEPLSWRPDEGMEPHSLASRGRDASAPPSPHGQGART